MDILEGESGHFTRNLILFGRTLRNLGLRISTAQVKEMVQAVPWIDLSQVDQLYYTTRAFFVHSPHELELFDQIFTLFWQQFHGSFELVNMLESNRIASQKVTPPPHPDDSIKKDNRLLSGQVDKDDPVAEESISSPTYSDLDIFRKKDFSEYSPDEFIAAKNLIRELSWLPTARRTRRYVSVPKRSALLDLRRSIKRSLRSDGEIIDLAWKQRKTKPRPLVVMCDISGSMERYSALFLHFLHTLVHGSHKIEAFVFGTRLTRLTQAFQRSDLDTALAKASDLVTDWSGGTRIGQSLKTFNYSWARRVLTRGAVAIIISDGWDRGDIRLLELEIGRLRRRAWRLIWLNPLLGAKNYQPLARGIRTVLPYVDEFLPLNNLASLEHLAQALHHLRRQRTAGLLH